VMGTPDGRWSLAVLSTALAHVFTLLEKDWPGVVDMPEYLNRSVCIYLCPLQFFLV